MLPVVLSLATLGGVGYYFRHRIIPGLVKTLEFAQQLRCRSDTLTIQNGVAHAEVRWQGQKYVIPCPMDYLSEDPVALKIPQVNLPPRIKIHPELLQ